MPVISLPDGSQRHFEHALSVAEVAAAIGAGLAKAALAGKVDGQLVDTSYLITHDCQLAIITDKDPEGVSVIRHSTAHLLAQAVKHLFPEAQVTIGPVIDEGFYYDFAYQRPFTPEDLEKIQTTMEQLAAQNLNISRSLMPRDEAVAFFHTLGEHYKAEIIASIPSTDAISLYQQGDFTDLCRGPHVPSTGKLKAFKLMKVAGAYWRGDSRNPMLQRIYGTAWATKKDLDTYLHRLAEAERRDHRRIGQELNLFSIQEDAGGGLVFWHPNGARIRRVMEQFWFQMHENAGYDFLYTPHIANLDLWRTSGHADFYAESMFEPIEDDNQSFQLKPMNCPFHVLIYKDRLRSYRDLPLRWAEMGTVYRREMSGALHGLMRVRGFTQDDAHIFCREEHIEAEILRILDLTLEVLQAFGFQDFEVNLSTRPEKAVGSDYIWYTATEALQNALAKKGLAYEVDAGGGAFYGPKIDIKIRDAIGRLWQCSTIQLDFNLPERFDMEYVDENNERRRPIMIHRALLGSVERFFGVLIEHYAGIFPAWLAPVQVAVISITDKHKEYAASVCHQLLQHGFRVEADLRNEKIGLKIRERTLQRIPYMLITGDREMEQSSVAVRTRKGEDLGDMTVADFIHKLRTDIADKK
jgi:threonyl-tRNA synthetase